MISQEAFQAEAFEQGQGVRVLDEMAVVFQDGQHRMADQAVEVEAGTGKRRDDAVHAFSENAENVGQHFPALKASSLTRKTFSPFMLAFKGRVQARVLLEGDEDRPGPLAPDDLARDRAGA